MKRALRSAASRLLERLAAAVRAQPVVVVHGFPADEGNAVEVVRGLLERYRGTVCWLVDDPTAWRPTTQDLRLEVRAKSSLGGVRRYLHAECVLFTHGLYGDARPASGRTFVNLWHGDGFKIKRDAEASRTSLYPAHFVVGSTRLLTERKARDFKMPASAAVVTGNPRVDQFAHPIPSSVRSVLVGSDAPFVVWLPTFRHAVGIGTTRSWSDVDPLVDDGLTSSIALVVRTLNARGIEVLIKPHPLDAQMRSAPGARLIDDAMLDRESTTLYSLLGTAAGIITDYSSVWTDYLLLDRPIGFVTPDRDAYRAGRGLYPADVLDWLPGPELCDEVALGSFADELVGATTTSAPLRAAAAERLGLAAVPRATDALLDRLEAEGAFARSGRLLPRPQRSVAPPRLIERSAGAP